MPDIDLFLWNKIRLGDKEAFELLFNEYYRVLCLFAKRYTHNMDDAREIIQRLFIYLWEHRVSLQITTSLKSYLFQAVRYNSVRYLKDDLKTGIRVEIVPDTQHDPDFFDHIEYAELQVKIFDTIEALPDQCKRVFMMSRFEQCSHSRIAAQLEISLKTVEAHITKALKILHENLDGAV
jgi:RNA polymerase sigma-70 factor, ECF subfamily